MRAMHLKYYTFFLLILFLVEKYLKKSSCKFKIKFPRETRSIQLFKSDEGQKWRQSAPQSRHAFVQAFSLHARIMLSDLSCPADSEDTK